MSASVLDLTESTFHTEVLRASQPVLVDFWAPWCAPCAAIDPALVQMAQEYEGRVRICRINTADHPATGMNFRITSVPTFLLFQGGSVVGQVVGARVKEVRELLERALA